MYNFAAISITTEHDSIKSACCLVHNASSMTSPIEIVELKDTSEKNLLSSISLIINKLNARLVCLENFSDIEKIYERCLFHNVRFQSIGYNKRYKNPDLDDCIVYDMSPCTSIEDVVKIFDLPQLPEKVDNSLRSLITTLCYIRIQTVTNSINLDSIIVKLIEASSMNSDYLLEYVSELYNQDSWKEFFSAIASTEEQ